MPTEAVRRKLAEIEQQKILAKQAEDMARMQREQERVNSQLEAQKRDTQEKSQKRIRNEKIFKESGILAGLERIKSGLINENQMNVQLLADGTWSKVYLLWGPDYAVKVGNDDLEIETISFRKNIWGQLKHTSLDYHKLRIRVEKSDDLETLDIYFAKRKFDRNDWGNQEKVDEWLANCFLNPDEDISKGEPIIEYTWDGSTN